MKKLLLLLLFPLLGCATTITSFEGFQLDVKEYSYLRPNGNQQEDNGEYAYTLASFTVNVTGTYSVENIGFHNVLYVGTDNDYTTNESYTFIGENTPNWKADTMFYVYDVQPNLTTPSNPLYFADNDDNDYYSGEDDYGDLLFSLSADLETNTTYYGIITTYDPKVNGAGTLRIDGPGNLSITYLTTIPEPSTYALLFGWVSFMWVAISQRQKSRK
jgi:hypothetical protein